MKKMVSVQEYSETGTFAARLGLLQRRPVTYVLDTQSTAFDTLLKLLDAKGKLLAENDDIVPNVNRNSRILFIPMEDGVYPPCGVGADGAAWPSERWDVVFALSLRHASHKSVGA
jgi:hypothetical protein